VGDVPIEPLTEAMKRAGAVLREAGVPFALTGGLACWAREQIDWEVVRERAAGSPFAAAFFTLIEELGILERARSG
jgi:hypothetical protein